MKRSRKRVASFLLALLLLLTSCMTADTAVMAAVKQPKKITLNYKSTASYVGGTVKRKVAAVTPKKAAAGVTWTSSNKKLASVSSKGVVKAKKAGTVTITAKSKVNSKAKCKINNIRYIFNGCENLKVINFPPNWPADAVPPFHFIKEDGIGFPFFIILYSKFGYRSYNVYTDWHFICRMYFVYADSFLQEKTHHPQGAMYGILRQTAVAQ